MTKGIVAVWALLTLAGSLTAATAATPQWVKDGLLIEHPGKIRVEYLGQTQDDPPQYQVVFNERTFTLFDGAIGPDFHSAQLWQHTTINPGERVLEVGTGIGCLAIFAAETASKVVATDISPRAVENAKYNVGRYGVQHLVEVREGDLFGPVAESEKFEVILFNIIYPYSPETLHFWKIHERFFAEVGKHLADSGRIYYQAGYLDNLDHIRKMVADSGYEIMEMNMWAVPRYKRQPMVFTIRPKATRQD